MMTISTPVVAPFAPLSAPTTPFAAPTHPFTILRRGPVAVLRSRAVIVQGGFAESAVLHGERLVSSVDDRGGSWWIAAEAVWADAATAGRPERPRPIGLATAGTRHAAILHGLSDRLGYEAVAAFGAGQEMRPIPCPADLQRSRVLLLDGRLGADIPTVVALSDDVIRWGAGETWDIAVQRAVFGAAALPGTELELLTVGERLAAAGLGITTVDLGTPRLTAAGTHRLSVQLLAGDDSGR